MKHTPSLSIALGLLLCGAALFVGLGQRPVQSAGVVGRYTMMAVQHGVAVQDTATGAVKLIPSGSFALAANPNLPDMSAKDRQLFGLGVPFEQLR